MGWTLWKSEKGHIYSQYMKYPSKSDLIEEIPQFVCSYGRNLTNSFLAIFSVILLLIVCGLSWKLRNVPKHFQETKALLNIVIAVALGFVVVAPVWSVTSSEITRAYLRVF